MPDTAASSGQSLRPRPRFVQEVPTGWVTGIFNKSGRGHAKQFELPTADSEKRARASGWRPRDRAEWAGRSDADPSSYIHNALQQLGVGVGHELYDELMGEVDAREVMTQDKQKTVTRLGLDTFLHRHLINVASLNDLLAIFFLVSPTVGASVGFADVHVSHQNRLCLKFHSRWGKVMMDKEEDRVAAENDKAEQEEEGRWDLIRQGKVPPPRRSLPWRKDEHQPGSAKRTMPATSTASASALPVKDDPGRRKRFPNLLMPHSARATFDFAMPATLTTPATFTAPVAPATPVASPSSQVLAVGSPSDTTVNERQGRKRAYEPEEDGDAKDREMDEAGSDSSDGIQEYFRKRRADYMAERRARRGQS